jgi:hypothetical protein
MIQGGNGTGVKDTVEEKERRIRYKRKGNRDRLVQRYVLLPGTVSKSVAGFVQ